MEAIYETSTDRVVVLIGTCCLAATKSGQTQNDQPRGPIRLGGSRPTRGPVSVYTLRFLQVGDTKPVQYIWILQKQAPAGLDGPIEPNETAFRSLNSPLLREFVSHLPEDARIMHSPMMLPGPDPTMKVGSASEPGLQDFIKFCRNKKVEFVFGTSF